MREIERKKIWRMLAERHIEQEGLEEYRERVIKHWDPFAAAGALVELKRLGVPEEARVLVYKVPGTWKLLGSGETKEKKLKEGYGDVDKYVESLSTRIGFAWALLKHTGHYNKPWVVTKEGSIVIEGNICGVFAGLELSEKWKPEVWISIVAGMTKRNMDWVQKIAEGARRVTERVLEKR